MKRDLISRIIILSLVALPILAMNDDKLPPINAKIIAFVNKVIGKKVDRGECWDLISYVLDSSKAAWDSPDGFGKKVDPQKDVIFPGDIVSMKHVTYTTSNGAKWNFPQHYAIVYRVTDKDHFKIANQNVNGNRKVIISELSLRGLKGAISFFQPLSR